MLHTCTDTINLSQLRSAHDGSVEQISDLQHPRATLPTLELTTHHANMQIYFFYLLYHMAIAAQRRHHFQQTQALRVQSHSSDNNDMPAQTGQLFMVPTLHM